MTKTFPDNEFLKDKEAVGDISGKKFAKACKRKQQEKDDLEVLHHIGRL